MKTFMVSLDPPERNRDFAKSIGANITLLSDPDGNVAREYGVLAPSGNYAMRWTFTIDRAGIIRQIDKEVQPASHGSDLVNALRKLGFKRDAPEPSADAE